MGHTLTLGEQELTIAERIVQVVNAQREVDPSFRTIDVEDFVTFAIFFAGIMMTEPTEKEVAIATAVTMMIKPDSFATAGLLSRFVYRIEQMLKE